MSTRRASSALLDGRVSTVIDGTGVARGFTDLIREVGVTFTPVTITAGGSQSRGEHGYWHVAKSILLSELAAQLETGRLRIAQSEMGRELIAELFRLGGQLYPERQPDRGRARTRSPR